jgi:hypothetical protein
MQSEIYSALKINVIDKMPGSLPMGGIVADTPIFCVDKQALELFNKPDALNSEVKLTTLALDNRLAFVIDNVLMPEECELIVDITEQLGYRPEAPGIQTPPGMRMNESVHWLSDEIVLDKIFKRIAALLPKKIDNRSLHPRLSQRMNFYKYNQHDVFNRHIDGAWPGYGFNDDKSHMIQWPHVESMLTMLLYLNGHENGVEGGCTKIYGDLETIEVKPQTGRALFFRHGFGLDSVQHTGMKVTGETPKYVARINVIYENLF